MLFYFYYLLVSFPILSFHESRIPERESRGNTQFTWELLRIPLSSNINSGSYWLQSVWFCRLPSCTSWWFLCRYVPGSPWRYRCPLPNSTTRLHMYVWMNETEYRKQADEGMRKKNVIGWIWAKLPFFAEIRESKNGQDIAGVQLPEC